MLLCKILFIVFIVGSLASGSNAQFLRNGLLSGILGLNNDQGQQQSTSENQIIRNDGIANQEDQDRQQQQQHRVQFQPFGGFFRKMGTNILQNIFPDLRKNDEQTKNIASNSIDVQHQPQQQYVPNQPYYQQNGQPIFDTTKYQQQAPDYQLNTNNYQYYGQPFYQSTQQPVYPYKPQGIHSQQFNQQTHYQPSQQLTPPLNPQIINSPPSNPVFIPPSNPTILSKPQLNQPQIQANPQIPNLTENQEQELYSIFSYSTKPESNIIVGTNIKSGPTWNDLLDNSNTKSSNVNKQKLTDTSSVPGGDYKLDVRSDDQDEKSRKKRQLLPLLNNLHKELGNGYETVSEAVKQVSGKLFDTFRRPKETSPSEPYYKYHGQNNNYHGRYHGDDDYHSNFNHHGYHDHHPNYYHHHGNYHYQPHSPNCIYPGHENKPHWNHELTTLNNNYPAISTEKNTFVTSSHRPLETTEPSNIQKEETTTIKIQYPIKSPADLNSQGEIDTTEIYDIDIRSSFQDGRKKRSASLNRIKRGEDFVFENEGSTSVAEKVVGPSLNLAEINSSQSALLPFSGGSINGTQSGTEENSELESRFGFIGKNHNRPGPLRRIIGGIFEGIAETLTGKQEHEEVKHIVSGYEEYEHSNNFGQNYPNNYPNYPQRPPINIPQYPQNQGIPEFPIAQQPPINPNFPQYPNQQFPLPPPPPPIGQRPPITLPNQQYPNNGIFAGQQPNLGFNQILRPQGQNQFDFDQSKIRQQTIERDVHEVITDTEGENLYFDSFK